MTEQDDKVRENRLRRRAKRLGLDISKSRARTFKIDDLGGWQVLYKDVSAEMAVLAGERFDLQLKDVGRILEGFENRLREAMEPMERATAAMNRTGEIYQAAARSLQADLDKLTSAFQRPLEDGEEANNE